MDMAIHERWKKIGKFLVMRKNDFNFIILFVALSLSFSPPKPVVSIDDLFQPMCEALEIAQWLI